MASNNAGAAAQTAPPSNDAEPVQERFSPEEEADMLKTSHELKAEANTLFSSGKIDMALNKYHEAVSACPVYFDYELAVLQSNIAACHLKLEEWKDAIASATSALNSLDKFEKETKEKEDAEEARKREEEEAVEFEIVSPGARQAGPPIKGPSDDEVEAKRRKRAEDITRIRAKALMRRARARSEQGGWSNLEGAVQDYTKLKGMPANLDAASKKTVELQLRLLPPRVKEAQEMETAEMWGKLKDLGNGLLKPFGLSTENFKMVKDEKTGGYSMNFEGGNTGK